MSSTTALTAEYKRVIAAKFVTQRDGSPMHCVTCGCDLAMGRAFAATPGTGWHSYCADCAVSFPHQVRGLVTKLTAMGVKIPDDMTTLVISFLQNETTANAVAAKVALMTLRQEAGRATREASSIDISSLNGHYTVDGVTVKVDTLTSGKWAGWSFVKDANGCKLGNQRPGQRYDGPAVETLRQVLADIADAAKPLISTVPAGYYGTTNPTDAGEVDFWRVSVLDDVFASGTVKVQRVLGGGIDDDAPRLVDVRRVTAVAALAAIEAVTPYLAGLVYAEKFTRCMVCNRHLSKGHSREVGMGPDCEAAG